MCVNNRITRAEKAQEWVDKMGSEYGIETFLSIRKSKFYTENSLNVTRKSSDFNTEIVLRATDTVSAIFDEYRVKNDDKVAALNFASFHNPGGGFLSGSKAQEECLCAESNLYNILKAFKPFYEFNNIHTNYGLYANHGIYTPLVTFKREKLSYCNIISVAAPNRTAALKHSEVSEQDNYDALKSRIGFVLDIAKENRVNVLILGAFGCGVFGQDPKVVAEIFKEQLSFYDFKKVIFAIPDENSDNYKGFKDVF